MVTQQDDAIKFEEGDESLRATHALMPVSSMRLLRELHAYRLEYEKTHPDASADGKSLTTTLPAQAQSHLWRHRTQDYVAGWPAFARAFFEERCGMMARDGRLDDMADGFVKLFIANRGKLTRD